MKDKEEFHFFLSGFLSNFYPAPFVDSEGAGYSCSEQYYMAKKAIFFNDTLNHDLIMGEKNPKQQKKYGRSIKNFKDSVWMGGGSYSPAFSFMSKGCYYKFTQNTHLRDSLLNVIGTLVEANPHDSRWGIGRAINDSCIGDPSYWRGTNLLGKLLTNLRDNLIIEERKRRLF